MSRRPVGPGYAAALSGVGFHRHAMASGTEGELDVYRRPAQGRWVLEARQEQGPDAYVDVGLTLDSGQGGLIGPIHRALSPAALASALPHIVASLEALAEAAESLRCPNCNSWAVMMDGENGPFLACGQPRKSRRPFDRTIQRCRQNLLMEALIVYREPRSPW